MARDDFDSFARELDAYIDGDVPRAVKDRRDAMAMEALRTCVLMTIVDTGRARGNWQVTTGEPVVVDILAADRAGFGAIARASAAINAVVGAFGLVWVANGLPYMPAMNDGTHNFTKTGAVHMVEAAMARVGRMFQ
jgi:hypothetical protein